MTTTRKPAVRKPASRKPAAPRTAAPQRPTPDNGDRALNALGWLFVMLVWSTSGAFTAWWCTVHPSSWGDAVIADLTVGAALLLLVTIRMWGRR